MRKIWLLFGLAVLLVTTLVLAVYQKSFAQPNIEPVLPNHSSAGWAGSPELSEDGRIVAFISSAPGLVAGDQNSLVDVFIKDRQTGELHLASKSSSGIHGNGWSYRLSLSADGRFVAFTSTANNLIPSDRNGAADIFVHDTLTGETSLASVASGGDQSNGWSDWPAISGDGRYVAFSSASDNLVLDDHNNAVDVFVHDRLTLQTQRVSVSSRGIEGDAASGWATAISSDSRWIAFPSLAGNLSPGDRNGARDIFIHNRVTGVTERVPGPGSGSDNYLGSDYPALSASGGYLAFTTTRQAGNNETPGRQETLVLYDRDTQKIREVSRASYSDILGGRSLRAAISGHTLVFIDQVAGGGLAATARIIAINLKSGETILNSPAESLDLGISLSPDKPDVADGSLVLAFAASPGKMPGAEPVDPRVYVMLDGYGGVPYYTISGQVTDSTGSPLRSVDLFLGSGRTVRTDRQGFFLISGVRAGNHLLIPKKEGFLFQPDQVRLNVGQDLQDIRIIAHSDELLEEARKDIGMPYSFHRGCESELEGCGGAYHGFHFGYCTDLILDAYRWGVDFNLQFALERDALAHPDHFYRWRNARNSHDMWRYFHYTGQMLTNDQPYHPGDVLFFDWDGDSVIDHVSLLSAVDRAGRPEKMIDATGKISYNPSGLAAELDWEAYHEGTVRGHARWQGSYGATRPATPPDLQVLQIAIDSPTVTARLFNTQGQALPGDGHEPAGGIPGGSFFNQRLGMVLSVISPLASGDMYLLELEGTTDGAYNLQIQTLVGSLVTDYLALNRQTLNEGEIRLVGIQLLADDGVMDLQLIDLD